LSHAESTLRRAVADLADLGRHFALVGGLAVSVRSEPRLTRDADLAVSVADDRDAEALVRDLQARGWRVAARALRGRRPGSGHRARPQDRVDLAALLARAEEASLMEAGQALAIVTRRGFHRGRDLSADLAAAVEEFRG
jgi:hypothetical protein